MELQLLKYYVLNVTLPFMCNQVAVKQPFNSVVSLPVNAVTK